MIAIAIFYSNRSHFIRDLSQERDADWRDVWDHMVRESNNNFDKLIIISLPGGEVETYTASERARWG